MNNSTPSVTPTFSKGERTKYRLANAMRECMKTTPVDRITVKQLTEYCEITRQTFYRNFLDKYDLINWYFDIILLKSFEHMGEGKTIYEALLKKYAYIEEEHLFFAAAFRSDDRNSLKEHDFELILDFYVNLIKEKTGRKPENEIQFILEMYCQSSVYMTAKWVTNRLDYTPAQLASLVVKAMPEKLMQLFIRLNILK